MNIQKIEKFVLILIACWAIQLALNNPLIETIITRVSTPEYIGKIAIISLINDPVRISVNYSVQLGIAVWLYIQARQDHELQWLWALSGLILSIKAAILYFLVQLFRNRKSLNSVLKNHV